MNDIGKVFIVVGSLLLVAGVLVTVFDKVPGIGRLPGDILIRKGKMVFYFPFATCILISVILTFCFQFFGKR